MDFERESDFSEEGYYYNLRNIRNKLVHDKLVLHSNDWNGKEDDYNIKIDNMLKKTIELLKLVRSAIIYLINSVEIDQIKLKETHYLIL